MTKRHVVPVQSQSHLADASAAPPAAAAPGDDGADHPSTPEVIGETLKPEQGICSSLHARSVLVVRIASMREKQSVASMLAAVVRGASIGAMVPLDKIPVGVVPRIDGGSEYSTQINLKSPDQSMRDSATAVMMSGICSMLETYGFKVQPEVEQDGAPS